MKKWKQLLVGSAATMLWLAPAAHAQNVARFAANFLMFDGSEVDAKVSNTTSNPILFYDKTLKVPPSNNVLYVSIYGTTDTHNSAAELINCQVDGVACNNAGMGSKNGSPAGWVTIAHADADLPDVAASYSWCAVLPKKTGPTSQTREVTLRLASDGTGEVFMEQIHVFVDGSKIKDATNACTDGDITPGL